MQLIEFKILLAYLFKNSHIIGIDICGKCVNEVGFLNEIKEEMSLIKKFFHFEKKKKTKIGSRSLSWSYFKVLCNIFKSNSTKTITIDCKSTIDCLDNV